MRETQVENINIKKELKKVYPHYKISVTQNTGTASGWKHINISTDIKSRIKNDYDYNTHFTETDQIKYDNIIKQATKIIRENSNLSTYYADDGYDTQHECFLLNIDTI